jgi:hypothetical protein
MPGISLDPLSVAQLAASILVDEKLASVIGPYAVIFLCALGGAGYALGNNKTITTRMGAFWYMSRAILFSLLLTVPTSTILAKYSADSDAQWFFIPVAAVLSYIADPNRLKGIVTFFSELAKVWLKNWVNKGEQPK